MKNKRNGNAQVLVILGVILAISVFLISSLASEIANIDFIVSTEKPSSISREFSGIKESFGTSLNYNLAEPYYDSILNRNMLRGNIIDINDKFEQTKNEFFNISLLHGYLFDAYLNRYTFSYDEDNLYYAYVTLLLDDGSTRIMENVTYSIRFVQYTT